MHLTRQKRVLGDVGFAGVFVQRQEEEPDDADDNAQEGEEVGEADEEKMRVIPQIADRG